MTTISSEYAGTASLLEYLNMLNGENGADSSSAEASSSIIKTSSRATAAYGGATASSAVGQAALRRAMEELSGAVEGRLTFAKISEYREFLEMEFTATMKRDLVAAGLAEDTEFTLSMDAQGRLDVECADANAKEKIMVYLQKNSAMCEQFGYIQALGNVSRASASPAAALAGARFATAEFTGAALEAFFSDALNSGSFDYSSLTATVPGLADSSQVSFFSGLNYTV
jgi:hypothetical protein